MIRKLFILNIILTLSLFGQTTYYISSSVGNDQNNGKSQDQPIKTLNKLSTIKFYPGDKILFKSDDIWFNSTLEINDSGNKNNPILFSTYGNGNKPIISSRSFLQNWQLSESWKKVSELKNVWEIKLDCEVPIDRLWLNDQEASLAHYYKLTSSSAEGNLFLGENGDGTNGVCESHQFYFDHNNNKLYLYAPSNPANYFTSIILPGVINSSSTLDIRGDFLFFENLDIQGGIYSSIELSGADNITFDNCNIGKYTNWRGIYGDRNFSSDKTSDYVTISNCTINSDWNYDYVFYTRRTPTGIAPASGTSFWILKNNLIVDWWMSIYVIGFTDNSQYHDIYNNEITSPRNNFGKAMQVSAGGTWGTNPNTYVKFYNNYIHDIIFGLQISSSNNYIFSNIFENMTKTSSNVHARGAGGFGSQIIADTQLEKETNSNFFINNTFINLIDYPHLYDGGGLDGKTTTYYINNLYINVGTERSTPLRLSTSKPTIHSNNLIFGENLQSNSSKIIFYVSKNKSYSVSEFNNLNQSESSKIVADNIQFIGAKNDLINNNFSIPSNSVALKNGKDLSSIKDYAGNLLISETFKDRFGNSINLKNPNIGAVQNSENSVVEPEEPQVNMLKVFLETAFNNNVMNSSSEFPTNQPFNINPWNYNESIAISSAKANFVDWLLIDLRSDINNISYRKAAILTTNGQVVNADGSDFSFNNITSGDYYIAIHHRNHLSIMSKNKISILNNKSFGYDFTKSQDAAYGNNALAELKNGVYGMFGGDGDANGVINNLDFGIVANKILYKGYNSGDLDLNGTINVLDYSIINKNILKKSQIP